MKATRKIRAEQSLLDAMSGTESEVLDVTEPPQEAEGDASRKGAPWKARTKYGYDLDVAMSALQKAIRRGREREALYWCHELIVSGYVQYFWRRLMIIAHEECGSEPDVVMFVSSAMTNARYASKEFSGRVEGLIEAHAVIALARATKSREAVDAFLAIQWGKEHGWRIDPHPSAVDKHTSQGKRLGKNRRDFYEEGRLCAGTMGRNDYVLETWPTEQEYLPRPEEPDGEPDVEIPKRTNYE